MIGRFFASVYSLVASLIGGIWLLVLYIFTIWIVVGSLSAIQVRQDISEANQAFNYASVTDAKQRYEQQLEQIILDGDRMRQKADTEWQLNNDIDSTLYNIVLLIEGNTDIPDYMIWDYPKRANFIKRKQECAAPASAADPVCTLISEYDAKVLQLRDLDSSELSQKLDAIQLDTSSRIESLQKNHPLVRYYPETDFWSVASYQWLLYVPQQVLVLFLTGAMGMLGSVITMTWSYVRNDNGLTLRRFLVLPLVGSMSAFIILVFVSAGQLTLTSGREHSDLNPFTLSFLAIISGLLSERAYTRMADVGSNFFRVDDGQPRWANGLKAAMETAGVSTADLARHLYIAEEEAARIVNENVTATLEQQRLIAACLRAPVRDIFTDVPPESAATVAAATFAAPDLSGLDAAAVEAALRDAHLEQGDVSEVVDASVASGRVVAQNPEPGALMPKGGRVNVTYAAAAPPDGPPAG